MTIVRVANRETPYVVLDKYALNDERISFKAKGLHAYLMSKPDGWKIRVTDLIRRSTDGRAACYSALKELEKNGYLRRFPVRDSKGSIEYWESVIYERPLLDGNLHEANQHEAKQDKGNRDLLINKEQYQLTTDSNARSVSESAIAIAQSEVVDCGNFEFEIAAAKAADAVAPTALLNATQGQPALAEGGVEGEEVLVKLQRLCKVGKHLEQKLMDNPAAARFALGQLEYALANGAPIDNPAGFFHNELKASIKRRNPEYNPQSKNTTKDKKNGQEGGSTSDHAEILTR